MNGSPLPSVIMVNIFGSAASKTSMLAQTIVLRRQIDISEPEARKNASLNQQQESCRSFDTAKVMVLQDNGQRQQKEASSTC